jgi:hypothetical protein
VHPPPQAVIAVQLVVPGPVAMVHALIEYAPIAPLAQVAIPAELTDASVVGRPFWQATQLAGCGVTVRDGST